MSELRRSDVEVEPLIDSARIGSFQLTVLGICALIALVEGFDTQAVAYVAPLVMSAWKISAQSFGVVFSASLVGAVAGAVAFGFMGDRLGRRRSILTALLIVALSTLAAAAANSMTELAAYRFLTGVGLGGTVPNATTLVSEYAPKRVRATFVTVMWSGYALGAAVGGGLAALLLRTYDWRSVLIAGGVLTLAVWPLAALRLPESAQYLAGVRGAGPRLGRILQRANPSYRAREEDVFVVRERRSERISVRAVFAEGRAPRTASLWVLFGFTVLLLFFMITWLPAMLNAAGLQLAQAIGATSAFGLGGILGSIVLGRLMDLWGVRRILLPVYVACALVLVGLGTSAGSHGLALLLAFLAGIFVAGSYHILQAATAQFYPARIRATGLGWAVGVGRVGSIVGVLLGGFMLSHRWPLSQIFLALLIPVFACAFAAIAFTRLQANVLPGSTED